MNESSSVVELGESFVLPDVLPVLPLKDTVLFPFVVVPLSVGPDISTQAIDQALADNRLVMLVAQRADAADPPRPEDLFELGTVGMIMRMLRLPDGRVRILVQGLSRARIAHIGQIEPFLRARIEPMTPLPASFVTDDDRAVGRTAVDNLERAIHLGRSIAPEVVVIAANQEDPGRLADLVASNLELSLDSAQALLETADPLERLRAVNEHLAREVHVLSLQHDMADRARTELDRGQREYFLRQQLRTIQEELGEADDIQEEAAQHRKKAEEHGLSEEAREELEKQLRRLERSHPDSAETTVIRTYLEWLTGLPWSLVSDDDLDLDRARTILDEDHYGLKKIKERILELLAVRQLKSDAKGPILCLVGPPGVGKTSLGRSIARTMGRQFVRLSLGGVRDEAEVRGHRRTYVGALPGRILQGLQQAGTSNPVFMLDEIDKIGADVRGDPSAALLEVLDPEQNDTFRDHYLGVPYDLSKVFFITTANQLDPIPPAFLDRLEVIRLSGYAEEEKLTIAKRHLLPKQRSEHGLDTPGLHVTEDALRAVIRGYTRESGLRNLEREIARLCRKVAMQVAQGTRKKRAVLSPRHVRRMLGVPAHFDDALLDRDRIGVATGLAWTAQGGELMFIEVVAVPGNGKLHLTGRLGEVMQESARTARTCVQALAATRGLDVSRFDDHDLHVHAPAGAVPKDGPSAGIAIAAAMMSLLTDRPVARRIAMTGEVTLRGAVLPIGGLREKALAARTAGIATVVLPEANARELVELPAILRNDLDFRPVANLEQALDLILRDDATKSDA